MKITLMHHTPLEVCAHAIRTCWQSFDKSDSGGEKDKALIDRVGNKYKHASTLEHLRMVFHIPNTLRGDITTQLLENKYILYNSNLLTINLRSLIDMLNDEKYYLARNTFLMKLSQRLPKEYTYLIELHINSFLGKKYQLDEHHIIYENGVVCKIKNKNIKDTTKIPFYKMPELNRDGYLIIHDINLENESKNCFHHRIIGKIFLENRENKPFINHIDGNKTNNEISNLEWVTSSENERHSREILKKVAWNRDKKLPSGREYKGKIRNVLQINIETNRIIKEWFNPTEAELYGGFSKKQISAVCCGRQKTHRNFKWRYKND